MDSCKWINEYDKGGYSNASDHMDSAVNALMLDHQPRKFNLIKPVIKNIKRIWF